MAGLWDDPSEAPPEEQQELSLQALTEAFSEVIGQVGQKNLPARQEGDYSVLEPPSEDMPEPGSSSPESVSSGESFEEESLGGQSASAYVSEDNAVEISPLTILEAILFVGSPQNQPLRPEMAASVMRNVRPEEIPDMVRELNLRYEAAGCPYHIVSEGPGYRLTLRKPYWHLRNRFYARLRETKLSQPAIDVLAIVAYQQPITAEQVQQLRGKPTGHILSHLVQRQLLRMERNQDGIRKAHYYTTDRFLALFGLESLDDLPRAEDIEKK